MYPPSSTINMNIEALSGICGSISIACWVVVFSPQIIENFRRSSADGLSLLFLAVWLAGDVFNILGSILQGVLPTMTILAVYYTVADIVLLGQCLYYRGIGLGSKAEKAKAATQPDRILVVDEENRHGQGPSERTALLGEARRPSLASFSERFGSVDGTHLSPATPLFDPSKEPAEQGSRASKPMTKLQTVLFNSFAVFLVCAAGVLGWYISRRTAKPYPSRLDADREAEEPAGPVFDFWGQVFGYLCAVLYLGSRVPQLLLNYRRKSTEGVSLLFFLFACIGNLTYVLSILAYDPVCRGKDGHHGQDRGECLPGEKTRLYGQNVLVNLSWLLGSLGTLLLDMGIFAQFFLYRDDSDDSDSSDE